MKESRHYTMLIPEKVLGALPKLEASINHIPGYSTDNLKEIISLICFHSRKNEEGLAHLKVDYLRKFVPKAELYLKGLVENGVIETSGSFREGFYSKQYKFTSDYFSKYLTLKVESLKLINRIHKAQLFLSRRNSKKYPKQNAYIRQMTIDPEVYSFIESSCSDDVDKYNYACASATRIVNRDFYHTVDDTSGRYHSNLTNMPKQLRQYIRILGYSLANIDIKNSQPYLSTLVLTNPSKVAMFAKDPSLSNLLRNLQVDQTEDVKKYIDLVVKGQLYEFLLEEFKNRGLGFTSRDDVKSQLMQILFDKNKHIPKTREVFAELFPEVHRIFTLVRGNEKGNKFRNFKRFSILLQTIEVHIVLDIVYKRLCRDYPYIIALTIHDSIMASITGVVRNILEEELTKFVGYKPSLRIE